MDPHEIQIRGDYYIQLYFVESRQLKKYKKSANKQQE